MSKCQHKKTWGVDAFGITRCCKRCGHTFIPAAAFGD